MGAIGRGYSKNHLYSGLTHVPAGLKDEPVFDVVVLYLDPDCL